jgi:hypothetical protein
MTTKKDLVTLLNLLVDKYGSRDLERTSEELELMGIEPNPTIEEARAKGFVILEPDDWGAKLILTYKGLYMTGRPYPDYLVLPGEK